MPASLLSRPGVVARAAASLLIGATGLAAAATADEAAQLKTTLTPLGGERAGNKDGSIPPWTGGLTTPTPGFVNGGRRPDPFAAEKPLFSITAKNMAQYADKLSEGTRAMLQRYPSFRVDVYPTHRTAAAPQWVYDNTAKNATRAKLVDGAAGPQPDGAVGGIPFPIPTSGAEVIWNHKLTWRLGSFHESAKNYIVQADGKPVMVSDYDNDFDSPYYYKTSPEGKKAAQIQLTRSVNSGPPIRAGEAIVQQQNLDESQTQTWVFLTGQRRVRKLPNSCCDTPTPFSSGILTFDELSTFTGEISRYDWKLVGKQEMFIPYNSNRSLVPTKDSEMITGIHLNPDHVRWELHRVWVVEATVAPGKRHTSPRSRYYVDEDTWWAVLGDRWDARNQLARTVFLLPIVLPEVPATMRSVIGMYDLTGGSGYLGSFYNEKSEQIRIMPPYPAATFSPDALAGDSVR